ncbi:hypothetical protein Q9299_13165 [Gemmobacter fulvus]|uniref:hypothetical protein n=1 Tax=Gemmobacter fulvus TaxID=2840474 RepID=UPI00279684AD|nr:hypothetical protein [Gemmobacter fulvus]MDQ1849240.1 hypothetical protein [Gemmobacter fulvus]
MAISRNFLLIGTVYLLVGIGLGSHMGASGDHSLSPVHAHINLLGFVLMAVFGLAYRVLPAMAAGALGRAHFWLHQIGALVLLLALFLMMSGRVAAESIGPVFPLAELAILAGVLCFLVNLWRHA